MTNISRALEEIIRELSTLGKRVTTLERVEKLYIPVYDDYVVQIGQARLPASSAPSVVTWRGSEVLSFSKSATNKMFFSAQLPHGYKEGSDIEFHIHVAYSSATTGNSKWQITYDWANIGGAFDGEITASAVKASPGVLNAHDVIEIVGTISGTGFGISSMLLCSISRLGADAQDTLDLDVYLIGVDFHVLKDTLGSRQGYIK